MAHLKCLILANDHRMIVVLVLSFRYFTLIKHFSQEVKLCEIPFLIVSKDAHHLHLSILDAIVSQLLKVLAQTLFQLSSTESRATTLQLLQLNYVQSKTFGSLLHADYLQIRTYFLLKKSYRDLSINPEFLFFERVLKYLAHKHSDLPLYIESE